MTSLTLANLVNYRTMNNYVVVQNVYDAIAAAYTEMVGRFPDITVTTAGTIATIDFAIADDTQAGIVADLAAAILNEAVKHTKNRQSGTDVSPKPVIELVTQDMLDRFVNTQEYLEDDESDTRLHTQNLSPTQKSRNKWYSPG
jgi:hypothetical protein